MIPIGTRCVYVGPVAEWKGRETCVVDYVDPAHPLDDEGMPYECVLDIEGRYTPRITWKPWKWGREWEATALFCHLIPIGHDPDAEARNVEREVEA